MNGRNYDFIGIDAFATKFYNGTSCGIINNRTSVSYFSYNIIIIDECQDLGEKHYSFICRLLKDNKSVDPVLVIMGDYRQSIFNKMPSIESDARFLLFGEKIYKSIRNWENKFLSESFRLTIDNANFINHVILNSDKKTIKSNKSQISQSPYVSQKPNYLYYNRVNEIFLEINHYLSIGYNYDDIFILSPSTHKSHETADLANILTYNYKNVYVQPEKTKDFDIEEIRGKIAVLTYYSSKGLERKIVIVMHFDSSFWGFYDRKYEEDRTKCPNILFVASSRCI